MKKTFPFLLLLTPFCFLLGSSSSWAKDATTEITLPSSSEDTTVTIKKGPIEELPEFEIISGTAEIAGDPSPGLKESYASWKEACEKWKKDLKDLNNKKDDSILHLNCNAPSSSVLKNGLQVYRSTGNYKLKTRMRTPRN